MYNLSPLIRQLDTVAAARPSAAPVDLDRYDWYADSCPCGLPAGECKEHPRAREAQRPPGGDWRVWFVCGGRGAGKTRQGAEWVRHQIESGACRRMALVGTTEDDAREVMVEGPSGILAVSPPDFMPEYEPGRGRLIWPNGAVALTYTAERPRGLRGPQHDGAWCDELAAWERPETFDMLLFGLRMGESPRVCVTTTPKAVQHVKDLLAHELTRVTRSSTYDNRAHLAQNFFANVVGSYEGTRLGRQEIHAEILDLVPGVWFRTFETAKHVSTSAEYNPAFGAVRLAIDCGTSQHTGAVWFQVRWMDGGKVRINVFADFLSSGSYSAKNASAIKDLNSSLPSGGRLDLVRVDPAARAHTGIGPAAYTEYEKTFGRLLDRWPSHGVVDGLELIEILLETGCLVIHPRCVNLIAAFVNYKKKTVKGVTYHYPADNQSPHEDLMDAARGGIRDALPGGITGPSGLKTISARRVF
jgi:hypothetical protein